MKKFLVIVDMQNDFITGTLGSEMAKRIVPTVKKKIQDFDGGILFTRDTHHPDYLSTQEGTYLPVEHCIEGTYGWQIYDELKEFTEHSEDICNKSTFGSMSLPYMLSLHSAGAFDIEEIELCGLCTDICVIANAVILKTAYPETKITVDSSCCAGTTEENHQNALRAMKQLQINII